MFINTHTHNRSTSPTCPKPRHPRRRVSVARVARPQLPELIPAPAVDAAARQQRAGVVVTRGEGNNACGKSLIICNRCIRFCCIFARAYANTHEHTRTHTHTHTRTHTNMHDLFRLRAFY